MTKGQISGKIHGMLRSIVYNKWVENTFYRGGYPKKINGETIRIPFPFHKYYPSSYEEDKTEFIKKNCRPGSTAIDIGAHIGVFSYFLGRQVGNGGKVYSFEPAPFIYSVLQRTIKFNGLENIVEARQQAMSNIHKDITFYVSGDSGISNANSIFEQNITKGPAKPITVSAVLLDDFMNDPGFRDLSFIKIDAEGAELEILKGGTRLIGKYRPYMTLEVHPKSFANPESTQREMFQLLKNFGYNVYRDNHNLDITEFCSIPDYFEVMLIPS